MFEKIMGTLLGLFILLLIVVGIWSSYHTSYKEELVRSKGTVIQTYEKVEDTGGGVGLGIDLGTGGIGFGVGGGGLGIGFSGNPMMMLDGGSETHNMAVIQTVYGNFREKITERNIVELRKKEFDVVIYKEYRYWDDSLTGVSYSLYRIGK